MKITKEMVSKVIDHTYLKTSEHGHLLETQRKNVEKLIKEAIKYQAFSICVRPHMVYFAKQLLQKLKSDLKITTVVGFPSPDEYYICDIKRQIVISRMQGADEFDIVLPIQDLKEKNYNIVKEFVNMNSHTAKDNVLKVILETNALTKEEIEKASSLVRQAFLESKKTNKNIGPRFFKTSTGFYTNPKGEKGATLEDVDTIIRFGKGHDFGIKPSGGISDLETAIKYIELCQPSIKDNQIDPYQFRIGSSSLLLNLHENNKKSGEY